MTTDELDAIEARCLAALAEVRRLRDAVRDVMNETDHSPIIDRDGDRWSWSCRRRGWCCKSWSSERTTKAHIAKDFGPLRFADEVRR